MKTLFVLRPFVFVLIASLFNQANAARPPYIVNGADTSCGGFPKLPVVSFEGSCLGRVSQNEFAFPRKSLELEPGRFLVTDMGGWDPGKGVLWELNLRDGKKKLTKRATGLITPHDIEVGPDGNIYIGERGQVTRFLKTDLLGTNVVRGDIVVGPLLRAYDNKEHRHPLMEFAFGKTENDFGDLYINMGSSNDNCKTEAPALCKEGERTGLIKRFYYNKDLKTWNQQGVIYAKGLRNSVGLLTHPSGTILQSENSQDIESMEEPYDEINVVQPDKHYGWPYCYNFKANSAEWKNINCNGYSSPYVLIPPHAAPLDMTYYNGSMFPQLQGKLLMAWHGHAATGARLVAYPVNERGLPVLSPTTDWKYNVYTKDGKVLAKAARPRGGSYRAAPYEELVSVWSEKPGVRPAGAPVGLTVASDGSVLIVEDKNRSVLILTKSADDKYEDMPGLSPEEIARIKAGVAQMTSTETLRKTWVELNQTVFQKTCATCHTELAGNDLQALQTLIGKRWITPGDLQSPALVRVLSKDPALRMPKGGKLSAEQQKTIEEWILESGLQD